MSKKVYHINSIFKKKFFDYINLEYKTIIDEKEKTLNLPEINNLFLNIGLEKKFNFINFVIPSNQNISYLTSFFLSMELVRIGYKNYLDNYSNLLINKNVELCANGKDNGKICKYIGPSNSYPGKTIIETIQSKNANSCKMHIDIENIFQFVVTNKTPTERKILKKNPIHPKISHLDEILNTKTFNNPSLINSEIILLTESENFNKFIETRYLNNKSISELISFDTINEKGEIEKEYESMILQTHSLYHIYEYFKKNKEKQKIIITDSIVKLSDSVLLNQIFQISSPKFMIFSNDQQYAKIRDLYKVKDHHIWKFEKSEISDWLDNQIYKTNDTSNNLEYNNENNSISRLKNYSEKKIDFIGLPENHFDLITKQLQKIKDIKTDYYEDINELSTEVYYLKYRLQDYLFGFTDEIKEKYRTILDSIIFFKQSKINFLNDDEFNILSKILLLLQEIDINNDDYFSSRQNELKEILTNPDSAYNTFNTTLIVDNQKVKSYLSNNIKSKWNLEIDINTSITPNKLYEYAIVTSELNEAKILKLIDESSYKNIIFLATPLIKSKINKIIKVKEKQWSKYYLEKDIKAKLCNLDSSMLENFVYPEHLTYLGQSQNLDKEINLDNYFYSSFDFSRVRSKYKNLDDVNGRLLIFNGDAFGIFSENIKFKNINNLFLKNTKKDLIYKDVEFNELKVDDYLLIRDSSDRDVVEAEAKFMSKGDFDYVAERLQSKKWFEELSNWYSKSLKNSLTNYHSPNFNYKNQLFIEMKKLGYKKSKLTLNNLMNNVVICPDDLFDLEILFKAIKNISGELLLSTDQLKEIFKSSQRIKIAHRIAGRTFSKKIALSLSKQNINIGREAMRVDYNEDGTIELNSNDSESPEAWIVQIQSIEKEIFPVAPSDLNRVQF